MTGSNHGSCVRTQRGERQLKDSARLCSAMLGCITDSSALSAAISPSCSSIAKALECEGWVANMVESTKYHAAGLLFACRAVNSKGELPTYPARQQRESDQSKLRWLSPPRRWARLECGPSPPKLFLGSWESEGMLSVFPLLRRLALSLWCPTPVCPSPLSLPPSPFPLLPSFPACLPAHRPLSIHP